MMRHGQCSCGKVRYAVSGEPVRVGICHCTTCRKETGSVFNAFAVWPRAAFQSEGETKEFDGHSFCPTCGSSLFSIGAEDVEIKIGTLEDAPTGLAPHYELWIHRRERWLAPLSDAAQHDRDRPRPPEKA